MDTSEGINEGFNEGINEGFSEGIKDIDINIDTMSMLSEEKTLKTDT